MAAVTLTYTTTAGTYAFTTTGRTAFARKADFDPEPQGGKPQRQVVTWTLKQEFAEQGFAQNQARYAQLLAALNVPEGTLRVTDEHGGLLFQEQVRVVSHDLPEQWASYMLEVSVQFRSVLTGLALNVFHATFTPTGGNPILLPNVVSLRDGTRTERPVTNVDLRRETIVTYSLSGRIVADMTQAEDVRRAALLAAKEALQSIRDFPNGELAYGSEKHVVRIDSVEAEILDTAEQLIWSVVAGYREFPDGSDVQVDYEVDTKQNAERSETTTAVQGRVMAKSRGAAEARAAQILTQYASGRVLLSQETKVTLLDGADGADGWLSLTFAYAYRAALDVLSWELKVETKDDLKTANVTTTYSGKVTAGDAASALTQAAALGDGKLPLRLSSTLTVETKSVDGSAGWFVECAFAYEYLAKGAKIYAEVTSAVDSETFGDNGLTISGFVAAADGATAQAAANGFQLAGRLLRSQRVNTTDLHQETDHVDLHVRVDFSFTYYAAHGAASMQYGVESSNDYESRETTVTYSGTCWGPDDTSCDSLINSLVAGESGAILKDSRTPNLLAAQGQVGLVSKHFSVAFSRPLGPKSGEDILAADYTVSITYSNRNAVLTLIPYGAPYVETGVNQSPASIAISGRCSAVTEASARAWALARRSLLAGYYERAPRVDMDYRYARKSGTQIVYYICGFQFGGEQPSLFLS